MQTSPLSPRKKLYPSRGREPIRISVLGCIQKIRQATACMSRETLVLNGAKMMANGFHRCLGKETGKDWGLGCRDQQKQT